MPGATPVQLQILPVPTPADTVAVNGACLLRTEFGIVTIYTAGIPVLCFAEGDQEGEDLFIANAMECGWASAAELSRVLTGRTTRSCQRVRRRYVEGGPAGVVLKRRGPRGARLGEAREQQIRRWHKQGWTYTGMARRLGTAPNTVRNALIRMGLPTSRRAQQELLLDDGATETVAVPTGSKSATSSPSEPEAVASSVDPLDRSLDRLLAYMGKIEDAEPIFAPGTGLPRIGVLLAIPLIVGTGIFEEAQRLYGSLGPAFYGLRTSLLVVVLMALLRIKHPENLKEYSPPELGRLIGLDRSPEVKTLRRKLSALAEGPSETLVVELAKRRVAVRGEALGFLYVDGHVRVYSGKYRLPKTHAARMRLSVPATQDVWVNDADGDPVFFITKEAHPSLISAMKGVVEETRELVGDRRLTFVFDRGGWSPRLFKWLVERGFDVITYRKGKVEPIPEDQFTEHEVIGNHGSSKTWLLHDRIVTVGSGKDRLQMRQVTRLQNGHQTHIVTTRTDLSASEVAHRMFHRWTQENFFKYMRDEFALDALLQYGSEDEDPLRDVPNPAWTRKTKAWRQAKQRARKLKLGAAELIVAGKPLPEKMERAIEQADLEVAAAKSSRDALPRRTEVGKLPDEERTVRLPARRKRLSDGLKMLAYQVESDLVRAVAPHYARIDDEGRTLIAAALQSAGDLEVTGDELRVTLTPQSSPHRTRAIAELCRWLDATEARFPGTALRLRYAIHEPDATD